MAKRNQRVTMKIVAEKAGVSMMTVSRALRNERRIAPETKRKVLELAEELGYKPNPMVGALMANLRRIRPKKTSVNTVAFVTSHPPEDDWRSHRTPMALYEGARERAEQLGFRIEEFWATEPGVSGARLSKILRARGITGVLIAPFPVPFGGVLELNWSDFAAIAMGYSLQHPRIHRVTNHHLNSIRLILSELSRRGYRRIGLAVEFGHDSRIHNIWTAGFMHYQAGVPARNRVPIFMPRIPDQAGFEKWRRRYRPEVILGTVGLSWLRQERVSMPGEVGFVSLDYHSALGDIAGIDQNHPAIGAAAMDLLIEQLYRNERGVPKIPKVVMVEGTWREGATVREAISEG